MLHGHTAAGVCHPSLAFVVGAKSETTPRVNVAVERARLRAVLMGENPMLAPDGFGVAPTPWRAVQDAAWRVVQRSE